MLKGPGGERFEVPGLAHGGAAVEIVELETASRQVAIQGYRAFEGTGGELKVVRGDEGVPLPPVGLGEIGCGICNQGLSRGPEGAEGGGIQGLTGAATMVRRYPSGSVRPNA